MLEDRDWFYCLHGLLIPEILAGETLSSEFQLLREWSRVLFAELWVAVKKKEKKKKEEQIPVKI